MQWRPQFPALTILLWVGKTLCHLRINRDPEFLSEAIKIPPLLPPDPPTARGGGPRAEVPDGGIGGVFQHFGHDHRLPLRCCPPPVQGALWWASVSVAWETQGHLPAPASSSPSPGQGGRTAQAAGRTRSLGRKWYPFLHLPAPFRPGFSQGSLLLASDFGGGGYRTSQGPMYEGWSVLLGPTPWLTEGSLTKTQGHAQVRVSLAQRAGTHPLSWCLDACVRA